MPKRDRDEPCGICHHYHDYYGGEVCPTCGHRLASSSSLDEDFSVSLSITPSTIIPEFLLLGSYDTASRSELLMKSFGITHVINTVPTCNNPYTGCFIYYRVPEAENGCTYPFEYVNEILADLFQKRFRRQQSNNGRRQEGNSTMLVLMHCMSGKSRSPAFAIAFLMSSFGLSFQEAANVLQTRHPQISLSQDAMAFLGEFEKKLNYNTSRQCFPRSCLQL